MKILDLDYERIKELKKELNNNQVEYIYHRFFENKAIEYADWRPNNPQWEFPNDWLSRYHLYFDQYKHLLEDSKILDIGAGLNFYNSWAVSNGARSADYIEPDEYKFKMGIEYLKLREMNNVINGRCIDISTLIDKPNHARYDVVFLLDIMYYTNNHMEIFDFIKNVINPKSVFFECTVIDDVDDCPDGVLQLWTPKTSPFIFESFNSITMPNNKPLSMKPSRRALFSMLKTVGFTIDAMYDYRDYRSTGESPPRLTGNKVFMILR